MALTLQAGDFVMLQLFPQGPMSPVEGGGGVPPIGIVDNAAGPVIAWPDGSLTTYALSTIFMIVEDPDDPTIIHRKVQIAANVGNAEGASFGLVIGAFKVTIDDVTPAFDVAVVKWKNGDISLIGVPALTIVPVNPNITQ